MLFLLSRLRLVLRKVMGQHREHVHTVQHSCQSRILPTGYKDKIESLLNFFSSARLIFVRIVILGVDLPRAEIHSGANRIIIIVLG